MPSDDDLQKLIELLPFYVNGTLDSAACAEIDVALASSPRLRDELAILGGLAQMMKSGGRDVTQGNDNGEKRLETMLSQTDAQPRAAAPQMAMAPAPREGLGKLLGFLSPRRWHPLVALSLAIALPAQAAVISGLNTAKKEAAQQMAALEKKVGALEFELASGPGGEVHGAILIQLNDGVTWTAVEALLSAETLSIVGGPSDGALTLSSAVKGAELDAQIARLKASSVIASADKAA